MSPKASLSIFLALVVIATMSVPGLSQSKKNSPDDVALELIGQVINPSSASSIQFGYLSYINGINSAIFSGGVQNETTALFTFYNDTTTTRVVNNGPIRIINRVGTAAIYLDPMPNGDFASPDSFRDGMPVLTATLNHQVIIDTVAGSFTTTFVLTVTSNELFRFGNENLRLGKVGQKLRLTVIGHLNTPGPPAGHFAGFMVGGDLTR